ncbi:MAG: hypothetical protein M5U34_11740 [Chloroflexi bacterium]|nr:hypothetical protein [Chloroflexota bacterium]
MSRTETETVISNKTRQQSGLALFFLAALLANFFCIFSGFWLAILLNTPEDARASLLAQRQADYGAKEGLIFAPVDPGIIDRLATDEAHLRVTPSGDSPWQWQRKEYA